MSEVSNNGEKSGLYQDRPGGQFKEGNPGKPKGVKHFTTKVQEALKAVVVDKKTGEPVVLETAVLNAVVQKLLDGDPQMLKLFWNYSDGLPKATIEVDDHRKDETKDQLKDLIKKLDGKQ